MDHRHALGRRLRRARVDSGASQHQVAEALGWPIVDFLLVEAVAEGADDGRLSALIDHYRIADLDQGIQELSVRDDPLSRQVRLLAEYEKMASGIRTFEPFVVPGLLQTRAYAEVALSFYASPETLGPRVAARLIRQSLLDRDDAPEMHFLIDESALHRWAGATDDGPGIMREQLDQLRQVARNPRIDIRIVPYHVGLHEGVKGSFVVLDFADPGQTDLLYLEDSKDDVVRAGPEKVQPYRDRFESLSRIAAPLPAFLGS